LREQADERPRWRQPRPPATCRSAAFLLDSSYGDFDSITLGNARPVR
jgi:hypothetical protein